LRFFTKRGIFETWEPFMNVVDTVKTAQKRTEVDHEPRPNAVTLAAAQEARDIMSGKIKVEWNHPPATREELKVQVEKIGQ
jgi:hypothetical protein